MEKVLSNDDKVRRAEEIYYRRKKGISNARFSKIEGEKKSYLGMEKGLIFPYNILESKTCQKIENVIFDI